MFLFDTGASVSIIGEKVAQDNHIQVTRLNTPRNIYEASGAPLDIIGESEFYVKLPVLGKVKRLTCLVLRGEEVDQEILISCKMLKKWNTPPSQPRRYVTMFVTLTVKCSLSIMS